jgi:HPt (histidine-containing phosphotransfer) domain-containing protein
MQDDGQKPMPSQMDESRLAHLLHIAGPVDGAELLHRLQDDLGRAETVLKRALPGPDLAAIRETTHVLTALAGAIGAMGLAEAARTLNTAANQTDAPLPTDVIALVLSDLIALCALVARKAAEGAAG